MKVALSFVMPTDSRARLCVSSIMLVQAPDLELSWRKVGTGRTVLHVWCPAADVDRVRNIIRNAHPKVEEVTPGAPGETDPRDGDDRPMGRHRR